MRACVVLLGVAMAQYTRVPDDLFTSVLNGYTDFLFDWVGVDYNQQGRDWPGTCATGQAQSPIDINETPDDPASLQIVTVSNSSYTPILFKNGPIDVYLQNNNYFPVYWTFAGTLSQQVLDLDIQQVLAMLLFQTPAEHTLNGVRYPLGVQLIYAGAVAGGMMTGGYQVYIFIQEGARNPALDQLINEEPLDVSYFLPEGGLLDDYFFYMGSYNMPVPDCVENMPWVISNYVMEASADQIAYFQDEFINDPTFSGGLGNIRELQPLNGRTVYHFIPTPDESLYVFLD